MAIATIVESLVLTHSPEVVVCALFDLKAQSSTRFLEKSPNMLAAVRNLGEEEHLLRRMHLALDGFFERRKEACIAAGCTDMNDYNAKIARGENLPRLPALLVIVEEFDELRDAYPEIFEFLDRLVREGRAYHIALLLAGQRYESALAGDIDEALGWRIALRTGTGEESQKVIDDPRAFQLRARGDEGIGYLRVGAGPLVKLRFFNAGAPYVVPAPVDDRHVMESADWFEPREFTVAVADDVDGRLAPATVLPAQRQSPSTEAVDAGDFEVSECAAVFEALAQVPTRPSVDFWLPPLTAGLAADELVGLLRGKPWHVDYGANDGLLFPLGQEDRPRECRQPVLAIDVAAQHLALVGGAEPELATALMTGMLGAALMYDPRRVQFYCVAGGGLELLGLRHLPHVAAIADKADADGVARVLDAVVDVITYRSTKFSELDIDAAKFFAARAADPDAYSEIEGGHVVVIVDGFVSLREAFADPRAEWFVPAMLKIATDGLSAGVHLVVSSDTWGTAFSMEIQEQISAKFELRLADPNGSMVSRREQELLPKNQSGWGLSNAGNLVRIGLPRLTDGAGEQVSDGLGLAAAIDALTGTKRSTVMAQLPEWVALEDLQDHVPPGTLAVALREKDLGAKAWDFQQNPHCVVVGARGSGRTTFLRTVCRAITDAFTPEEAQLHVVDLRRQLVGAISEPHTASHSVTIAAAVEAMRNLVGELQSRKHPSGTGSMEASTQRSWVGPQLFVVVDNAEMLSHTSPSFPFGLVRPGAEPLYEFALQGAELGLHIVYTAQLNQAYRTATAENPLWRNVTGMSTPTLILSGDRDLGLVAGNVSARHQPPGKGLWVVMGDGDVDTVLVGWTDVPANRQPSAPLISDGMDWIERVRWKPARPGSGLTRIDPDT